MVVGGGGGGGLATFGESLLWKVYSITSDLVVSRFKMDITTFRKLRVIHRVGVAKDLRQLLFSTVFPTASEAKPKTPSASSLISIVEQKSRPLAGQTGLYSIRVT